MSTNPLRNILGEIAPLPLLTHDQEIDLAQRIAAGLLARKQLRHRPLSEQRRRLLRKRLTEAQSAREALVLHNLPLVLSVAGRFRNASLDYDDLIQEGVMGLLKAADRYDPKRGTRFGTLAVWWIRQSIGRAIANTGRVIRLPVNRGWKVGQLRRLAAQMSQQGGDEPPLEEVARAAGVTTQAAAELLRDGQPLVSLDTSQTEPDERSTLERVADSTAIDPEDTVAENSMVRALEEALGSLEDREAQILRLRFGLDGGDNRPMPLREIARNWKMSPEGVRQISERAMAHLRAQPRVQALNVYLEG
jgi:RNA polymerase sigma factor (sigma-70 family)